MKVKLQIPQTLNSITLGEYQKFQKVLKDNEGAEESTFVQLKMLEIFCKADINKLRGVDLGVFNVAIESLTTVLAMKPKFSKKITINGKKYGFIPKLDDISLGEYVDLETYLKDVETFDKAMAVLYRPIKIEAHDTYDIEEYKGTDDRAEIMKEAGLSDALGSVLFFWTLGRELVENTLSSMKKEYKTMSSEKGRNSRNDGDGISQYTISQMETLLNSMRSQELLYINASLN